MRKLCFVCVILVLTTMCLAACDPSRYTFDYDELLADTDRIELIRYFNPDVKDKVLVDNVFVKPDVLEKFNSDDMEILDVLPTEKLEEALLFIVEEMGFFCGTSSTSGPVNLCIRLIYKNGNFEVWNSDREDDSPHNPYAGSFTANGDVDRYIGSVLGVSYFIDNFFPEYGN